MGERPLKILLVEDDQDSRTALKAYLEDLGHEVSDVSDMKQALQVLTSSRFNLLLSDIGLPDGTGWELLERAQRPGLFSVAMSGFGMSADRGRSFAAGYRHHLLKPVRPDKLEKILEEVSLEG